MGAPQSDKKRPKSCAVDLALERSPESVVAAEAHGGGREQAFSREVARVEDCRRRGRDLAMV